MIPFAELAVTTNFSFLRAGSHPEEFVIRAAEMGLSGIGIADRNSLAGVVRAHVALKETEADKLGLKLAIGTRLVFADGTPDILAYPQDHPAYIRLCRLLTTGKRRAKKGDCMLGLDDLLGHAKGLLLIVMPPAQPDDRLSALLPRLTKVSPGSVWLAASMLYTGSDRRRLGRLARIARGACVPLIAVNDVLYHTPERRPLQDVVTCIREHLTLDQAGRRLLANAERHLKPAQEMARLFRDHPEAVAETVRFLDRARFSLDELEYDYPEETRAGFASPQDALRHFTFEGAAERYPDGVPDKVRQGLDHELSLIGSLNYAPYFLTVHDIVRFARSKGILCQGRGSAANSAVCYCLGITEVDPALNDLLFERFVSAERGEPPDIDVDFEHERREEVIQYIYTRYGRERAGLAATVISYRARSAIREVGKVFGLSEDTVSALAGTIWGASNTTATRDHIKKLGLEPDDPRLAQVIGFSQALIGFPRHLSQHVGGFVITNSRLDEVVPIENAAMEDRTVVEWDKDDLDALKILKIDVLGLGMLTCLRKAFDLIEQHYGRRWTIASIPKEEPEVYRMLCRADSIGVFQVESRAQMSMLPRLRPKTFYDLVIEVAIVRPGPIQGDMVHPYLRRRQGAEQVDYPRPSPCYDQNELKKVLHKTLGVPLFQEQAMKIAIVAAGFTPSEADRLRRAMATFRRVGTIGTFQEKMVDGMTARGYDREFAERCFKQIEGFGEYGFPESHAASFALLVYASAWVKCRYPDAFAAALLNSQPMGFYAPAQIVRDAAEHGVETRPVDVNLSDWDSTLEKEEGLPGSLADRIHPRHAEMAGDIRTICALRLGLHQVKGLREEWGRLIAEKRGAGYDSVRDLWLRTRLSPAILERLAQADAFGSLGLSRRDSLWAVRGLGRAGDKDDLPLFAASSGPQLEPDVALPPMPPGEEVIEDYRHLSLSLKAHPVSFLRDELERRRILPSDRLAGLSSNRRVTVAGLVLVRQRPGTARGVIFMTIEDERGIANLIVWPKTFERYRPTVLGARLVMASGKLQNEAGVIHVVVDHIEDFSPLLSRLSEAGGKIHALARADHVRSQGEDPRDKPTSRLARLLRDHPELADELPPRDRQHGSIRALPRGRNFH